LRLREKRFREHFFFCLIWHHPDACREAKLEGVRPGSGIIGTAEGGYREETREAGALGQENATATAWEDHRRKETGMDRIVTRAAPYLYALLRIIGTLLYACHGAQKLLGLFGGVRGGHGASPITDGARRAH
jgi:hypothetical protein